MPALDYRLGIDVGGTNTDAVILDRADKVLAKAKVPTTQDVTGGIIAALDAVIGGPVVDGTAIGGADVDRSRITHAMLGTTHATNAVLERRKLHRVAVIRIGAPATLGVRPMFEWPADLTAVVSAGATVVAGGIEFDGRDLSPFDDDAVAAFLGSVAGRCDGVAITSVFAPVSPRHELLAAEIVKRELGEVPVSLSHEIGSVGLLERENATVLNAALAGVAGDVARALGQALAAHDLSPVTFFAQNDGTLMALDHALRYPVLTIGSGPANSIRGAAFLTGRTDALVADVGGTSTDVGVLVNGFPRESSQGVEIGGIRTNFRMPDLVTIALGGGTVISGGGSADGGAVRLGPESVGYRLREEALVFGGMTPTLTDSAVATGRAQARGPGAGASRPGSAARGGVAGRGCRARRRDRPGQDRQGRPDADRGRRRQHPDPRRASRGQRGDQARPLRRGERDRRRDRLRQRAGRQDLPLRAWRQEGRARRGQPGGQGPRGRRRRRPGNRSDRRAGGDPARLPHLTCRPDQGQGGGCSRRPIRILTKSALEVAS